MDDLAEIGTGSRPDRLDAYDTDTADLEPAGSRATPENGLARSLERRRLQAYLMLVIVDSALIIGTFFAISVTYFQTFTDWYLLDGGMLPAYLILPLYLTIAIYNRTYSQEGLPDWKISGARATGAMVLSAVLLVLFAFLAKSSTEFSRFVFTTGTISSIAMLILARVLAAHLVNTRWGSSAVNCLVIHADGPDFSLPNAFYVDAREHGLSPDMDDPHALDRLSRYLRNMDQVVVSCSADHRVQWAQVLKCTGIHGEVVDEASHRLGAIGVIHREQGQVSSLLVSRGELGLLARVMKRMFDLAVTIPAVLLLSPLLLAVAVVIKLEDGGPVFFLQRRMGRGNGFFTIYKFRSMRVADEEGARSTSKDDDRVTRIGRFIRRTSIDELPQLLNVIKGDMSLVGPRPHALGSTAGDKLFWQVDAKYWRRHNLRPGITGLAQIRGFRGATDTETDLLDRLNADLEYLATWSIFRDVSIILQTFRVLTHERAF